MNGKTYGALVQFDHYQHNVFLRVYIKVNLRLQNHSFVLYVLCNHIFISFQITDFNVQGFVIIIYIVFQVYSGIAVQVYLADDLYKHYERHLCTVHSPHTSMVYDSCR